MGRINQEIIEFAYSPKATASYELSLLVGSDSLYCLVNDAQLNVLALKSFHFDHPNRDASSASNLKAIFFEDPILKETYRVTKIAFTTPHFTFVPSKFYDADNRRTYFDNLTDLRSEDETEADSLRNPELKNVYLIDRQLLATASTLFPTARQSHVFTSLILGFQKIAEHRSGHQVFANVRDGWLQMLFFDGRDLIFANAFSFKTPQDIVYFLLNVYEQFKLNPEVTPLSIGGSLTEDSDIFKFIYRYIRHVGFVVAPPYFRLGQQFTGVPQHFYFDLFSIKLTE